MTTDDILDLGTTALDLILRLSAPAVLAALVVGVIVSLFQAATQIQEQTLPLVPKLIVVYGALALTGGELLAMLTRFAMDVYGRIGGVQF